MKLLLVNSAAPELWGGGEKWFVEAAAWFAERGHTVTLVARANSLLMRRAAERGVQVVSSRFGGDFDPFAMARAIGVVRGAGAEIVLTNFNKEAWHFGISSRFTGAPVVARHGFPLWNDKLWHRMLASRLLSHVIVNSEAIVERYRELRFDVSHVSVIYNGVSQVIQKTGELRRELQCTERELLLAAAGRLESQKRFDRLLRMIAEFVPETPLKLALFGQGPHERELRDQARALELDGVVRFMGFRQDFANVVGDADLLLLTSDDEGSPNVVLEAMAAGVPVLGFSVGSMPKILHGELAGYLISPGNETAFAQRLREILSNPDALRNDRSIVRDRILEEFSFDVSMRRYEEVLKSLPPRP